jgi:hypothetical protein
VKHRCHSTNPAGRSLAVDEPAVAEVMEWRTGRHVAHEIAIGGDYERVLQLRQRLQLDRTQQEPTYVCSLCGTPVYLVMRGSTRRFFFRHVLEDGRCTARTRGDMSQEEIDARRYNGAKDCRQHSLMKDWIAQSLTADPRFSDIAVEERWAGTLDGSWRRRTSARSSPAGYRWSSRSSCRPPTSTSLRPGASST